MPDPDAVIGRESESVDVVVQRLATAATVNADQLRQVAVDRLAASLPDGAGLVPDSVAVRVIDAIPTGAAWEYTVEVSGRQRPARDAGDGGAYRAA
jgi:hypothetical protein